VKVKCTLRLFPLSFRSRHCAQACKPGRGPTTTEWDHGREWGDVVLDSQPRI
jgi:hypothetical protein